MPAVLGSLGLRAAEAEHVVRVLGRGGPDLLPVDHPLLADQLGAGLERGQVAARARLAVALAPGDLAANRGRDELLLLPLLALLDQGGHQHHGADPGHVAGRVHLPELLADDVGLDLVGRLLGAAVALGNRAVQVALLGGLRAEAEPRLLLGQVGLGALGRPAAAQELLHLGAKVLVLLPVAEIHAAFLLPGRALGSGVYPAAGRHDRCNGSPGAPSAAPEAAEARGARHAAAHGMGTDRSARRRNEHEQR